MKKFFQRHWPELVFCLLIFAFYFPSLFFPLLNNWDDKTYILLNPRLSLTFSNFWHYAVDGFLGLYTPLSMYSLMLDQALFGSNYLGFHLTAILLHLGAAFLFSRVLLHLGLSRTISLLAALLWAIHPQRLESVAWLAERKDVLSMFLAMAAVLVFMKTHDRGGKYFWATLLTILSIAAKPATVFLPAIFLVYVLAKGDFKQSWRQFLLPGFCYLAYVFLAFTINHRLAYDSPPLVPPLPRIIELMAHNICFYIANTIVPFNLNPIYPLVDFHDWWIIPVALTFFAAILIVAYYAIRDHRWLAAVFFAFAACWWAMFLPNGNGVVFNPTDYADRYSYAPAAVLVAFCAYLIFYILRKLPQLRITIILLLCLQAGYASLRFYQYLPLWADSQKLFAHAINSLPENIYPNDKAIHCLALTGLDNNDADMLEKAALLMLKRSLGEWGMEARDTELINQTRAKFGMIFLISAKVMQNQDQEAIKLTEAWRQQLGKYLDFEMYDAQMLMPRFLNLVTELLCRNDRQQEAKMLLQELQQLPTNQLEQSASLSNNTARLSLLTGDAKTALAIWRKLALRQENLTYLEEQISAAKAVLTAAGDDDDDNANVHSTMTNTVATVEESFSFLESNTAERAKHALAVRAVLLALLLATGLLALAFQTFMPAWFPDFYQRTIEFFRPLWPYLTLFAVVFLLFSPSLTYGPLTHWDDAVYIINNYGLRFTWENVKDYALNGFMGLYTPLTMYSFMLDRALFGHHNYIAYHCMALLMQGGAAVLLALILRHLGVRKGIALAAALLWAVHPQRIESVAWIAERKDVLSGILALAATYAFMKSHDRGGRYFLPLLLTVLSIFAKPATVFLPVVFVAYVLYRGDLFSTWRRLLWPALGYICFLGIFYSINQRLLYPDPPQIAPLPRFVELISHNVLYYISCTFLPIHLNPVYPLVDFHDWWIIPVFLIFVSALLALVRWAALPRRWFLYAVLFFAAGWWALFIPNGNGIRFNPTDYADRYSYMAAAVLVAFVALVINEICKRKPKASKFLLPLITIYGLFCFWQFTRYLPIWDNCNTLFTHAIEKVKPGVYPNEKAIQSLCIVSLDENDPELLEGASLLMLERARSPFGAESRDGELEQEARENFGMIFLFCAKAMQGSDLEALRLARSIYARHGSFTMILLYDPNVTFMRYLNLLTEVFCRNNSLEEAEFLYREFSDPMNRNFEFPDIANAIARLALLLKEYQTARVLWERLAEQLPRNQYVQLQLQEVRELIQALPPEEAKLALTPPPTPLSPKAQGIGLMNPDERVMPETEVRRYNQLTAIFAVLLCLVLATLGTMTVIEQWPKRHAES